MTCPRRYEQNKHATDGHSISVLKGTGRDALSGMTEDHIIICAAWCLWRRSAGRLMHSDLLAGDGSSAEGKC